MHANFSDLLAVCTTLALSCGLTCQAVAERFDSGLPW